MQSVNATVNVTMNASCVNFEIPGCYYEFARRFPIWKDKTYLFQGFIPQSANKIFESTNG